VVLEDKKLRLRKLIEHWAEHNDEHSGRFKESALEAEELGLAGVAEELKEAAEKGRLVSGHLLKALEKIQ